MDSIVVAEFTGLTCSSFAVSLDYKLLYQITTFSHITKTTKSSASAPPLLLHRKHPSSFQAFILEIQSHPAYDMCPYLDYVCPHCPPGTKPRQGGTERCHRSTGGAIMRCPSYQGHYPVFRRCRGHWRNMTFRSGKDIQMSCDLVQC